jgi:hypothetical protein
MITDQRFGLSLSGNLDAVLGTLCASGMVNFVDQMVLSTATVPSVASIKSAETTSRRELSEGEQLCPEQSRATYTELSR